MKHFIRITALFLVLVMAAPMTLNAGAASATGSVGEELTLPAALKAVEAEAFAGDTSLTVVNIPDGCTYIGAYAFYGCRNLERVTIPDSVRHIGVGAFAGCDRLTICCTKGSETEDYANLHGLHCENSGFIENGSYQGLTWRLTAEGELVIDGRGAVPGYNSEASGAIAPPWHAHLKDISSVWIGEGVTALNDYAFSGYSFTQIHLPKSLTRVGENAFYEASVSEVSLPDSVTDLGEAAFAHSSVRRVRLSAGMKTIPEHCFEANWDRFFGYGSSLTEVILPEGIEEIGADAFNGCVQLTDIDLPDSLRVVGDRAFESCEKLKDLELPEGLKTIGEDALYCTSIEEIELPDSIETIGRSALLGLKAVSLLGNDPSFDGCCQSHAPRHSGINMPPYNNTSLESVEIGEGCNEVSEYAFSRCTNLRRVSIADTVQTICRNAFMNCVALASLDLPDSVTTIGASAFSGCTGLQDISIPESVTSIDETAFSGCESVTIHTTRGSAAAQLAAAKGYETKYDIGQSVYYTGSGDTIYYKGHTYKYVSTPMTWNAARDWCEAQGGHLVTINSEAEQNTIFRWLSDQIHFGAIWMGLIRPFERWITGEKVTYTNWGRNEPDNYSDGQDCTTLCGEFSSGPSFELWPSAWDDWAHADRETLAFVCEIESLPSMANEENVATIDRWNSRIGTISVSRNAFATKVVGSVAGTPWTSKSINKDPAVALGVPDFVEGRAGDYCLGKYGTLTLEFDVCVRDGEGADLYIFEVGGDVEDVLVEVSDDLETWHDVGQTSGVDGRIDLYNNVQTQSGAYKYVRLTDLGEYPAGSTPGADIDAVGLLNWVATPRDVYSDAQFSLQEDIAEDPTPQKTGTKTYKTLELSGKNLQGLNELNGWHDIVVEGDMILKESAELSLENTSLTVGGRLTVKDGSKLILKNGATVTAKNVDVGEQNYIWVFWQLAPCQMSLSSGAVLTVENMLNVKSSGKIAMDGGKIETDVLNYDADESTGMPNGLIVVKDNCTLNGNFRASGNHVLQMDGTKLTVKGKGTTVGTLVINGLLEKQKWDFGVTREGLENVISVAKMVITDSALKTMVDLASDFVTNDMATVITDARQIKADAGNVDPWVVTCQTIGSANAVIWETVARSAMNKWVTEHTKKGYDKFDNAQNLFDNLSEAMSKDSSSFIVIHDSTTYQATVKSSLGGMNVGGIYAGNTNVDITKGGSTMKYVFSLSPQAQSMAAKKYVSLCQAAMYQELSDAMDKAAQDVPFIGTHVAKALKIYEKAVYEGFSFPQLVLGSLSQVSYFYLTQKFEKLGKYMKVFDKAVHQYQKVKKGVEDADKYWTDLKGAFKAAGDSDFGPMANLMQAGAKKGYAIVEKKVVACAMETIKEAFCP